MDKLRKPTERHGGTGSGAEGTQPKKNYWAYAAIIAVVVLIVVVALCS